MGCWNETCMISQLPIMYGDEVVLILLKKQIDELNSKNSCYVTNYFKPYPCILKGTYDDYGGIENISGDIVQFIEIIKNELNVDDEDIINLYNKRFGEYDVINKIDAYLKYLKYIVSNRNDNNTIAVVMIHKELFDNLKGKDDYFEPIDKFVKRYIKMFTSESIKRKIQENFQDSDEFDIFSLMNRYDFSCPLANVQLTTVNYDSVKELLEINCALNYLRKLWFPQTCSGGQESINDDNIILNNFYSKYIKEFGDKNDEE